MKGRQLAAFEASSSDQLHRRPARRTWDGYAAFSIHLRGWPFRSTGEMLFAVLTTTERPAQARDIHHEPFLRRGNPGGGRRLGLALAALTLALLGTLLSLPGGSLTTGSGASHEASRSAKAVWNVDGARRARSAKRFPAAGRPWVLSGSINGHLQPPTSLRDGDGDVVRRQAGQLSHRQLWRARMFTTRPSGLAHYRAWIPAKRKP